MRTLLDTHVLIQWLSPGRALSYAHRRIIRAAGPDRPLWISDITLWEIANLYERGRIRLNLPLRDWLEQATAPPLVRRVSISPAVAAEVAVLPPCFQRDPGDRIIVASARVLGATLLTQDTRIIDSGLVPTVA